MGVIIAEYETLHNSCNCVWFFLSFASFTTEEIMSVVHFKTVISKVIGTNMQVFFFWQKLFVSPTALPSFFFLLVNDGTKYLFAVPLRSI